jgi:hypothetical protein
MSARLPSHERNTGTPDHSTLPHPPKQLSRGRRIPPEIEEMTSLWNRSAGKLKPALYGTPARPVCRIAPSYPGLVQVRRAGPVVLRRRISDDPGMSRS